MKVDAIMTRSVVTVKPGDSLGRAAHLMWDHDCGSIPVVDDDGAIFGVVTDRDICMAALTQGLPLSSIPVGTAMSRNVFACHEEDSVETAEEMMRAHQVRRLPVTDARGHLVGILSISDLARRGASMWNIRTPALRPAAVTRTLAAVSAPRESTS